MFKISTYHLVMMAVFLTIVTLILSVIFCNLGFKGKNNLEEKKFTYYTRENKKYDTGLNSDDGYKSGRIVVATSLSEYKKINEKYKIIRDKELTEKDFEESHYLYVIMGESACRDSFNFQDFYQVEDEIILNFTYNNCTCLLSSLRTRVYEISVPKFVTNRTAMQMSFIQNDGLAQVCDTTFS